MEVCPPARKAPVGVVLDAAVPRDESDQLALGRRAPAAYAGPFGRGGYEDACSSAGWPSGAPSDVSSGASASPEATGSTTSSAARSGVPGSAASAASSTGVSSATGSSA